MATDKISLLMTPIHKDEFANVFAGVFPGLQLFQGHLDIKVTRECFQFVAIGEPKDIVGEGHVTHLMKFLHFVVEY